MSMHVYTSELTCLESTSLRLRPYLHRILLRQRGHIAFLNLQSLCFCACCQFPWSCSSPPLASNCYIVGFTTEPFLLVGALAFPLYILRWFYTSRCWGPFKLGLTHEFVDFGLFAFILCFQKCLQFLVKTAHPVWTCNKYFPSDCLSIVTMLIYTFENSIRLMLPHNYFVLLSNLCARVCVVVRKTALH